MKIAIVGLGLIGGSLAKTIKANTNHSISGYDISSAVLKKAEEDGVIDDSTESFKNYDFVIISLYPKDTLNFLKIHITEFSPKTIVVDACGVKEYICSEAETLFQDSTAIFIGGHPMAGREFSGYQYSQSTLFDGASMILTPFLNTPQIALTKTKELFSSLGFGQITVTTAKHHDQVIAYTSQLAHVVSSAYMQSSMATEFNGFSAGSFADLTRVAKLNPDMWTELFLTNHEALSEEIDVLIKNLIKYRDVIKNKDNITLKSMLQHGSDIKESITK